MGDPLILETTFLIDFERERKSSAGPTIEFLRANVDSQLLITHTIAGELACGASHSTADRWMSFCRPFLTLEWRTEVDWRYGQIYRYLQGQGRLIGANDLWIAATALVYGHPVVTANKEHFRRVPELEVLTYR